MTITAKGMASPLTPWIKACWVTALNKVFIGYHGSQKSGWSRESDKVESKATWSEPEKLQAIRHLWWVSIIKMSDRGGMDNAIETRRIALEKLWQTIKRHRAGVNYESLLEHKQSRCYWWRLTPRGSQFTTPWKPAADHQGSRDHPWRTPKLVGNSGVQR